MKTTSGKINAIAMLKDDHKKVKRLFQEFEEAENSRERQRIADEVLHELKIHAELEEKIFYKLYLEETDDKEHTLMAEEEHGLVKILLGELENMKAADEHFYPKFQVMMENVKHHIEEEESDILPEAENSDMDLEEIGAQMEKMKMKLEEHPPAVKVKRVQTNGGHGRVKTASRGAAHSRR